jgi:penicillin-binding protein 1A
MSKIKRGFSYLFWTALSFTLTLVIVLGVVYIYLELQLPDVVAVLNDKHLQVPLRIYTSDGKLIAQYGAKRRAPVTLDQVPKQLIHAVLATEDARYYSHPGVDLVSLFRASKAVISSGRKVQGASTITMQVARNFFLSSEKTYSRKIQEMLLALKIDKELSKDKVLELYLNKIYFGNRAYGVAAAAEVYYGKKLNQLTLAQMAMLAGLPQAPSKNNPLQNPKSALVRRNHVLERMYEVGFINKKTYLNACKEPNTARFHGQEVQVRAPYMAEMVRQLMVQQYGFAAYDSGFRVYTTLHSRLQMDASKALDDGLLAYSKRHGFRPSGVNLGMPDPTNLSVWEETLRKMDNLEHLRPAAVITVNPSSVDALLPNGEQINIAWSGLSWARPALEDGYVGKAPSQASDIVTEGDVIWVQRDTSGVWNLAQIPKVQGAIVSLNPQDGGIVAISGGFDYETSNFNRAVMARRQPGSNFKPFIYSAGLAKGFTLASTINDAPIVLRGATADEFWRPMNDDKKFYGPTRLRVALVESRNVVSVRLLEAIGIKYALNYMRNFGFDPESLPRSFTLALGTASVSPLQIATGYTVFANGGYRVTPYFLQKIVDENGKVIYEAKARQACPACITDPNLPKDERPSNPAPQVLTPQNAFLVTQAMRDVIQSGTARAVKALNRSDLAGKTGTTNDQVDGWFSGFNSQLVTSVWMGFDNLASLHEWGAQTALPIWMQYMGEALKGREESTMPRPPNIIVSRIDPATGQLARASQRNAIYEYFTQDHVPGKVAQGNDAPATTPA